MLLIASDDEKIVSELEDHFSKAYELSSKDRTLKMNLRTAPICQKISRFSANRYTCLEGNFEPGHTKYITSKI